MQAKTKCSLRNLALCWNKPTLFFTLVLEKLDAENIDEFHWRDETEAQEKTENSSDGADESDLGDFFFRDELWNVRVLDVDGQLGEVLSSVGEDFFLKFSVEENWHGLESKQNFGQIWSPSNSSLVPC